MATLQRLWTFALAMMIAAGPVPAATTVRLVPAEPERILAQKPTGPAQPQPGQRAPQQPPAQEQQQEQQDDEPIRLEPLPTGNELDEFVQRAVRPGLENLRSFTRLPGANGLYRAELNDPALPSFVVNLVEERNIIPPDQAFGHFQRGIGTCRDVQPGERFDEAGLVIQTFTAVCRVQSGNEVQAFVVAGHDDQRTQVLSMVSEARFGEALRARGALVYQAIVGGG